MRRFLPLAVLPLAACSTTPRPLPAPTPAPAVQAPLPVRTGLTGLTQAELQQRFGPASFSLREGTGLKLQWQSATCVLDAYLYPPQGGTGTASVLHADARRPGSGESLSVESCVTALGVR